MGGGGVKKERHLPYVSKSPTASMQIQRRPAELIARSAGALPGEEEEKDWLAPLAETLKSGSEEKKICIFF